MANSASPMPWWQIIAILIAVGLVVGAVLGLLGLSTIWTDAGVGAAVGVIGVALINRRRKAAEGSQDTQ